MHALENEVCWGNQVLFGKKRSVADSGLASARLQQAFQGVAISKGDTSRDGVKLLQRALIVLGFSTSKSTGFSDGSAVIDGDFGGGTERGVKQLQSETTGLTLSGTADAATLNALGIAVAAELQRMSDDERTRQRDVLDGSIALSPAELKQLYRVGIQRAASVADVKEEVIAAITIVESSGGGNNRPKFESHHSVALLDMHEVLLGLAIPDDAAAVGKLVSKVSSIPIRAGENGQKTKLSRGLVQTMAGSGAAAKLRQALLTIQGWSLRDTRQLASSWGWGQIMGWHTLRPAFQSAGIGIGELRSQDPARQIATLGTAISLEPSWKTAAGKADAAGDYSFFAEAYNGASRETPKNAQYAAAMRQAAAEYRNA